MSGVRHRCDVAVHSSLVHTQLEAQASVVCVWCVCVCVCVCMCVRVCARRVCACPSPL